MTTGKFEAPTPRVGMPIRVTVNGESHPGLVAYVRSDTVIDAVYFLRAGRFSDCTGRYVYHLKLDDSTVSHWSWP